MRKIINGITTQDFISGWWGKHNEGVSVLNAIGLPTDKIPFDIKELLTTEQCTITIDDAQVTLMINKQDAFFEFSCKSLNRKRSFKLYREWDGTDLDTIIKMESYSVGECVRKILVNKNIL
jgi:hypothetical protein